MPRRPWVRTALLGAAGLALALPVDAEPLRVEPAESVFAVITHKAGVGSGLAHNHLVVAPSPFVEIDFDAARPLETRFALAAAAADLLVDDPERQRRWNGRILGLGILDEELQELSEKNRRKIGDAMRGRKQLDVDRHPGIGARLGGLREETTTVGDTEFPLRASLELEIHGQSQEVEAAVRYEWDGEALSVEAVAEAKFSDFGIRPYSALLGAVKNRDEFHFLVAFTAHP